MKRSIASTCSEADSEGDASLEDSSPFLLPASPKQFKSEAVHISVEDGQINEQTMAYDHSHISMDSNEPLQQGTSSAISIQQLSTGNATPHGSCSPPSEVKKKKTKKKNEDRLDWKNYDAKKKNPTKGIIPHEQLADGGQHLTETLKEGGNKEVDLKIEDATSQISHDEVDLHSRQTVIDSPSSVVSQSTRSDSSQATCNGGISEEYDGHESSISPSVDNVPPPVSFGTKSNPVADEMNHLLLLDCGLPKQFGKKKVLPTKRRTEKDKGKESRAKSSSSERGALGRGSDCIPRSLPPLNWKNLQKNANDDDAVSNGGGGCCEEESTWKSERRGDRVIPDHTEEYIDSHCHLDFLGEKLRFHDMDVLRREFKDAFPKTLKGCITNFIKPSNWKSGAFDWPVWIKKIVKDNLVVGTSWGVHPHYSGSISDDELKRLNNHIVTNRGELKIVAVGECGVDLSGKNDVPLERQLEVFRFQVEMAYDLDLPIIIHCREGKMGDPEDDVLNVLKSRPNHPIHRHCFTRDIAVAKKWLSTLHNCSFGFTPMGLYSDRFEKLVNFLPASRMHLETDAPYFRAEEYAAFRRPTNHSLPGAAIAVAVRVAEIKGLSVDEIIRATRDCTQRIYRLPLVTP